MQVLSKMIISTINLNDDTGFRIGMGLAPTIINGVTRKIKLGTEAAAGQQPTHLDQGTKDAMYCKMEVNKLFRTAMSKRSGFPELFAPIITKLERMPALKDAEVETYFREKCWVSGSGFGGAVSIRSNLRSTTGFVGLNNLGNTCYANSIIQALFTISSFRHHLLHLSREQTSGSQDALLTESQHLFAFLEFSQRQAIAPSKFLGVARPSWFVKGAQQDCVEFLQHFLDRLEESCKDKTAPTTARPEAGADAGRAVIKQEPLTHSPTTPHATATATAIATTPTGSSTRLTSPSASHVDKRPRMTPDVGPEPFPDPTKVFRGKMMTTSQCLTCEACAGRTEDFNVLSLALSEGGDSTIEKMIETYLAPEKMDKDNQYQCEHCNGQSDTRCWHRVDIPQPVRYTLLAPC